MGTTELDEALDVVKTTSVPIHDIGARWIGKYERSRLAALADLKTRLESSTDD